MKHRHRLGIAVVLSLAFFSFGCEGDQGPQGLEGPEGPQGPPGTGVSPYTYQGNYGDACQHCHAITVGNVALTGHTEAYEDLSTDSRTNLYCLQCHTTGFDSQVEFGDTEIAPENRGPDIYGYDDYYGVDTEEAAERRAALENVQCESCHGPMGPDFNAHLPLVSFSTHFDNDGESTSLCFPCHETQIEEWVESTHAKAGSADCPAGDTDCQVEALTDEWGRSSCDYCHSSEGYIRTHDPRYLTYEFEDEITMIGCPTCHDPHQGEAGGGNYAQLRDVSAEEVQYTYPYEPGAAEAPRMAGYGPAQTCAQCHHARRNTANVQGQIEDGYAHFGPHPSPQMDMFIGAGSYLIPTYTYTGTHAHQSIPNGCVKCHMVRETELHGEITEHAFHTWEPTGGNCEPCHTGLTDFDVNGKQTEIQGKINQIAVILGYTDTADFVANFEDDSLDPLMPVWQREVAYAAIFVYEDGSSGVHNYTYATSLLDNAIAYANTQIGP